MDWSLLIVILLIPGIPLFIGALRRGHPLAFILPLMAIYGGLSMHYARTGTIQEQALMLATACLALFFGWFLLWMVWGDTTRGKSRSFDVTPSKAKVRLLSGIGFGASFFLFATKGVPLFSGDSNAARLEILSNGYLGTLAILPLNVLIVLLLCTLRHGDKSQISRSLLVAGMAFATLWLFASRGLAIFPLLAVGSYYLVRYPRYLPHVLASACALVFVVGIAGYQRNYEAWGPAYERDLTAMGYDGWTKYLAPVVQYTVGTSQAVDIILRAIPSDFSHPGGAVFFSALLSPLPGEQPTAGSFLKSLAGMDFEGGGLAMGSTGGFYMDFGLIGVIVGFVMIGVLFSVFDARSYADGRWTLVFAWMSGHLILMNYSHPIPTLAIILVPFVLFWACRRPESVTIRRGNRSRLYSVSGRHSLSPGSAR